MIRYTCTYDMISHTRCMNIPETRGTTRVFLSIMFNVDVLVI